MSSIETSSCGSSIAVEGVDICYKYPRSGWKLKEANVVLELGEILALTGPNGSGKTTFMKLLATIKRKCSGQLRIMGLDSSRNKNKVRSLISYVPQKSALVGMISSYENLYLAASFHGNAPREARHRALELSEIFDLENIKDCRAGELSGGQYRRVALAMAFAGDPKLLLLDEPTAGMDASSRDGFHVFLRELVGNGNVAAIMASHDQVEVGRLADKKLLFNDGKVFVDNGQPEATCRDERTLVVRFLQTVPSVGFDHFARISESVCRLDAHTLEFRMNNEVSLNRLIASLGTVAAIDSITSGRASRSTEMTNEKNNQWVN